MISRREVPSMAMLTKVRPLSDSPGFLLGMLFTHRSLSCKPTFVLFHNNSPEIKMDDEETPRLGVRALELMLTDGWTPEQVRQAVTELLYVHKAIEQSSSMVTTGKYLSRSVLETSLRNVCIAVQGEP